MSWYSNWPYRRQITLDAHMISGNHTNFPFLFKLTGNTHISSNAHSGGKDFIFTDSNGVRVNCERDGYLGGSGCFWVRAPTLSNYTTATFYLYYGTKTDNSLDIGFKASGVWDPSHQAVYHLGDKGVDVYDSTVHGYNGTGSTSIEWKDPGIIGKGVCFYRNANQNITVLGDNFNYKYITIEAWIKTKYLSTAFLNQRIVAISGTTYSAILTLQNWLAPSHVFPIMSNRCGGTTSHATALFSSTAYYLENNQWRYLAGITQPESVYVDGVKGDTTYQDYWTIEGPSRLVIASKGSNYAYSGSLDEVRISNKIRSTGWIRTTYSSMKYPLVYTSLGSPENAPILGDVSYYWDKGFPQKIDNNNFYWNKGSPIVYISITEDWFGSKYEGTGSDTNTENYHNLYYKQYNGASTGTVQRIYARMRSSVDTPYLAMAVIYDSSDNIVGHSDEVTIDTDNVYTWINFPFSVKPTLTVGAYYYLDVWSESIASYNCQVLTIDGDDGVCFRLNEAYDGDPVSSIAGKTADTSAKSYSIYCVYTMEGEVTTTTFYTMAGNPTGWLWKLATINVDSVRSGTATGWQWKTITSTVQRGVPSGLTTDWKWNY
jgi:hypothetical protein